jgi:hypothetical protein
VKSEVEPEYASVKGLAGSILTFTDLAFAVPEFSIKTVTLLFSLSSRSSTGSVSTSATSSVVVPSTLKTILISVCGLPAVSCCPPLTLK